MLSSRSPKGRQLFKAGPTDGLFDLTAVIQELTSKLNARQGHRVMFFQGQQVMFSQGQPVTHAKP